jgi:carbon-monoxide dehydrogenase medium subunit
VKPPPFDYQAPRTVRETLDLIAEAPEDTSLLAGGQSLMPLLNMRLARPALIVDLNRIEGLDNVTQDRSDGTIRMGAMVRQRVLETSSLLGEQLPLLAEAAEHIAHIAIRTRGTVGGSLAYAHPTAELPAAAAALGARLVLQRRDGERTLPTAEFFAGALMTSLEPGEMLVAVDIDPPLPGTGSAFVEVARTHGAFAQVGAAALVRTGLDGRIEFARLALCGVGSVPYVPEWLDDAVVQECPVERLFAAVAERISKEVSPSQGEQGDYRRRVSGVLVMRALTTAASRSERGTR